MAPVPSSDPVVDHKHGVARRVEHLSERLGSSTPGSRARCRWGGRRRREARTYHRHMAKTLPPERRHRRPARPPGRHLRDPRRAVVPRHGPSDAQQLAFAKHPGRWPSWRSRGVRPTCPGVGKTIELKVVEIVEDGEMHALTKRRGPRAGGRRRVPSPSRRRPEDRGADLDQARHHDARRAPGGGARRGGCASCPAWGRGARRRSSRRSPTGRSPRRPPRTAGCSGCALPAVKRVVEELSAHPAAIAVSEAGSVRRRRETVRDLDFIATSSDPRALIAAFCEADWVSEVVARGDTKATVVGHQGLRFDLRIVSPRSTATSSSTSPARRTTTSSCGRRPSGAGSRSRSTASRPRRAARSSPTRPRRSSTPISATSSSRPSCARTRASSPLRASGRLPKLVELSDLEGEMHCHSTWSSDGHNTIEEMAATAKSRGYSFLVPHRPFPLPAWGLGSRRSGGRSSRSTRASRG